MIKFSFNNCGECKHVEYKSLKEFDEAAERYALPHEILDEFQDLFHELTYTPLDELGEDGAFEMDILKKEDGSIRLTIELVK